MADENFLDLPQICLFYSAPGADGIVGCSKGHRHHEDEFFCLTGECPDYTPDPTGMDTNLLAADIMESLAESGGILSDEEMTQQLMWKTVARRSPN